MNAVVVTFDCLPFRFLGAYGNSWVRTPNFDRLAAESVVFHRHFASWVGQPESGVPWWTVSGRDVLKGESSVALMQERDGAALEQLKSAGVRTLWRGEARDRRSLPADRAFESRAVFLGEDSLQGTAESTSWIQMAGEAQRLIPRLHRTFRAPWLLWLQSAGLPAPWSAPLDWALKYLDFEADDDDSKALRTVQRLCDPRQSGTWTDLEWKFSRGLAAGYVTLIDAGLGLLLDALDASPGMERTLLIVMSGRGRVFMPRPDMPTEFRPLLSESVLAPLYIRRPDRVPERRQELVQCDALWPTLQDWFRLPVSDGGAPSLLNLDAPTTAAKMAVTIAVDRTRAGLRTADHYLIARRDGLDATAEGASGARFFAKPDDFWETLDLASNRRDETEEQMALLFEEEPVNPEGVL